MEQCHFFMQKRFPGIFLSPHQHTRSSPPLTTIIVRMDVKEELNLSKVEMALIEMEGSIDGNRGFVHGLGIDHYQDIGGRFHRKKLANSTVRVLNKIIEEIRAGGPIDEQALETMSDGVPFNNEDHPQWALAKRFVHLYHELVMDQIRVDKEVLNDKNGIPNMPYTVGYPLAHALDVLKNHPLKDDASMGGISPHDQQLMVDYMISVDTQIDSAFWYILYLLVFTLVIKTEG
jgi:hypothetical protein